MILHFVQFSLLACLISFWYYWENRLVDHIWSLKDQQEIFAISFPEDPIHLNTSQFNPKHFDVFSGLENNRVFDCKLRWFHSLIFTRIFFLSLNAV